MQAHPGNGAAKAGFPADLFERPQADGAVQALSWPRTAHPPWTRVALLGHPSGQSLSGELACRLILAITQSVEEPIMAWTARPSISRTMPLLPDSTATRNERGNALGPSLLRQQKVAKA